MKKILRKYRFSKFRCFMNGLTFATLSAFSITLCLMNILDQQGTKAAAVLPFIAAIVSIMLGFYAMFRPGYQQ